MARFLNATTSADVNAYFLRNSLWPAIIYTSLLMLVGTAGNIMVIIVYRRQCRRSVTRMFIYALAILDLGNCLITMPAELMILIEFTTFPSPAWCKASRYLTYTFNGTSSIILITIALDRYFKVCRPTQSCITINRASYVCIGAFLFTAVFSVPALVLYGEMIMPLLVTSRDVTILPLDNEYTNMSSAHTDTSVIPKNHDAVSQRPKGTESYGITGSTFEAQGRPAILLYGTFCLLDSDHIDSALPLLFYASMFVMYLVMVVLVVFFYSKVARTMFILTSKHSKMFTFYGHKNNSTPATNSAAGPEGEENVYFSRPGSRVLLDLGYQDDRRAVDSFTGSENGLLDEVRWTNREIKPANYPNDLEGSSAPNTGNGETGYGSADANFVSDISSKKSLQMYNSKREENAGAACEVSELLPKNNNNKQDLAEIESLPVHPTSPRNKSKSMDDISRSTSPADQIPSSLLKRSSRKKSGKKVPKIKIEHTSSRASELNIAHLSTGNDNPLFLSSNSLLLRRFKSAENVNSLTRLSKLQVPEGRSRKATFRNRDSCDISKTGAHKRSHRENTAGIGQISNSNVDLAVVRKSGDVTDGQNTEEDTLTMTKNSMKGKKKLCVIPLTGLSSKTAIQVQDSHQGIQEQNSENPEGDVLGGVDIMKSSHSVDGSSWDDQEREDAEDGTEPKQPDSNVALRPKTPQSNKSDKPGSSLSKGKKTPASDKVPPTPRKEIVSTADILQERHQRGSLHPVRTSRMLFVISLVFVISFLPFFVIALARSSVGSSFMTSLSDLELGLISVFIRSSLISNAVNPIVYGLLSTHFRRECTGIMCCIFRH